MSASSDIPQFDFGFHRGYGTMAVIFNSQLCLIGADADERHLSTIPTSLPFKITTLDISAGYDSSFGSPSTWNTSTIGFDNLDSPSTFARCSADIASTPANETGETASGLFLFWNQCAWDPNGSDGSLTAAYATNPGSDQLLWSSALSLLQTDGQSPIVLAGPSDSGSFTASDVSVTAFGPGSLLVACARADNGSGQYGIFLVSCPANND
jgi:hypothetical protein